jgi:hypothetical protein
MNTFQWVMIGFAVLLVAPILLNKVKALIPERKPIELPPPVPQPNLLDHDHTDLVDVVECWQHLIECCKVNGMKEAADEIYKVFPLFANKGVDNE